MNLPNRYWVLIILVLITFIVSKVMLLMDIPLPKWEMFGELPPPVVGESIVHAPGLDSNNQEDDMKRVYLTDDYNSQYWIGDRQVSMQEWIDAFFKYKGWVEAEDGTWREPEKETNGGGT